MTRSINVAALSLGLGLGTFGCSSFLAGDKLTNDPNNPSQATAVQLFVGVQTNMFTSQENTVAMTVCMWMQQCAGVGGRFVDQYGRYVVNEFSWDGNWFQVYTGGGLVDLRKIEAASRASGDSVFLWIAAAHTLKARFYLHTIEAASNKAAIYGSAITEATAGISSSAGDLLAYHSPTTSERNIWYQFQTTTFGQDLVAGKALVDIMNARSDPRLPAYFAKNALGTYGGDDPNVAQPGNTVSPLHGIGGNTSLRMCPSTSPCGSFRQPLVTYQENELILAEAYNQTGNDAFALTHLHNARAVPGLLPLVGITGPALLDSIMTEKYVTLYQNIEVWNDYRRTCRPALTPYNTGTVNPQWRGKIPGRLFYGGTEMNVNPHIPDPGTQLGTNGFRNPNDTAD